MAFVFGWTGDNPGALREISKALSLDPHNPVTLLIQGQEFTRLNRWSDAEETFARLQTVRANYWLGHEELGIAYRDQGKYAKAAEEFRAAGIAGSNRALPLSNLSAALLHMGDVDGALDAAKKCLSLGPDDDGEAMMAAVLRCQGKPDEALSHALKAVAINPDDAGHWMDLGDSYSLLRGHQAAAKDAFEKAVKQQESIVHTDPTEGPAWMGLALAQAKTNRLEESIKSVKLADNNFAGDMDSQLTKVRTLALLAMHDEAFATASACLSRGAIAFQFKCMPDINDLRNDLRSRGLL